MAFPKQTILDNSPLARLLEWGFRASGPKYGKNRKSIGFGRTIGKWPPNPIFEPFFLFFGSFVPIFWGRPETNIFPIFSYFGPEARKAGGQGRNSTPQAQPHSKMQISFAIPAAIYRSAFRARA